MCIALHHIAISGRVDKLVEALGRFADFDRLDMVADYILSALPANIRRHFEVSSIVQKQCVFVHGLVCFRRMCVLCCSFALATIVRTLITEHYLDGQRISN